MKVEIKKIMMPSVISSSLLLILGLFLFFKSGATLMAISYFIGAILMAIGIIAIIRFIRNSNRDIFNQLNIVYGVISILAGIFLITMPEAIGSAIPIIVGIIIIISSSMKIQQALILKNLGSRYFVASLITALICLICGVIILFNPFKSAVIVTKIIGLFIAIYAILDLVNTIILRKSNSISVEISTNVKGKRNHTKEAKVVREIEKEDE